LTRLFNETFIEIREGDVTRPPSLAGALLGVDTVVQCVQFPGFPVEAPRAGRTFLEVDARGTATLVAAARQAGVRKFVYVSGVGADAEAEQVWFRAKGIAERAVVESRLEFSVVRPSWTYGPGDSSLNRFVDLIRYVPLAFPQIGPGTQEINPVFIEDVAVLLAECVTSSRGDGATIEIGGRRTMTIDEIIRTTMRAVGREKPIVHVPLALAKIGGAVLEWFPGQLLSAEAVEFVTQSAIADLCELDRLFPGRELTSLPDALATYLPRAARNTA
jgi:NADH dehydrogenase